ncbi:polysaccharide deacetylase family protein [Dyella sp. BiH032]|uniref:polysaccharide deacetylase family protein n=1 Tax=Dyella sp. BiH032 TaxID=3075430 RepID=UPI0028930C42|nr:polysaccharide deacetylase family protein [Dyella sp. BiH032]WNL44161.1 polysaccharide deacetylase family protein [Dyella sp. BiH032]
MPTLLRRAPDASRRLHALLCLLCLSLCVPLAAVGTDASPVGDQPKVAILVYHRFADRMNDGMTVRMSTFEAQLAYLHARGYRIVPLREVLAWLRDPAAKLPPRAVVLTVDDGHRSVYEALLPVARRERLPVTLFIYPSAISNAPYAMTWEQLRELHATHLFDIQSHTYWHPNFKMERRQRDPADYLAFVDAQLLRSKARLERELGVPVDLLAWPFGVHDPLLHDRAAQAGYVAGFTLEARLVHRGDAIMALPRFLMTDAVTPSALARLLGERERPPEPVNSL